MQDWFFNAGIVGFKNILKHAENEIQKLRLGIYPYEQELIDFKTQLENKLKQQI